IRMSPASTSGKRSPIDLSTTAAGTINQIALGFSSFFTKSGSEELPVALSLTSSATASGDMSKTTHWWPCRRSLRAMLAPIRPRPIIPSCMEGSSEGCRCYDVSCLRCANLSARRDRCSLRSFPEIAVTAYQRVGRTVMAELRLIPAGEFWDDPLRQDFAELDAPLIE